MPLQGDRQRLRVRPAREARDADQLHAAGAQQLERRWIAGVLDGDGVARFEQRTDDQVQRLARALGQHDLVGRDGKPAAAQLRREVGAQAEQPQRRAIAFAMGRVAGEAAQGRPQADAELPGLRQPAAAGVDDDWLAPRLQPAFPQGVRGGPRDGPQRRRGVAAGDVVAAAAARLDQACRRQQVVDLGRRERADAAFAGQPAYRRQRHAGCQFPGRDAGAQFVGQAEPEGTHGGGRLAHPY